MGIFSDYLDSLKKEGEAFAQFVENPGLGSGLHLAGTSIGETVHQLGNALEFGQRYVTRPGFGFLAQHGIDPTNFNPIHRGPVRVEGVPGHATKVNPFTYQGQLDALPHDDPKRLEIMLKQSAAKSADSYTQAFNAAVQGDPVSRFMLETIYDPINIATLGSGEAVTVPLRGGLKVAGVAAKAEEGSKLAQLAMKAPGAYEVGNELFNKALTLPIVAPFKGIKGGLKRLGWLDLSKAGEAAGEQSEIFGAIGQFAQALKNESDVIPQIIAPDPKQSRNLGVLIPGLASREAEITPLLPKGYTWTPTTSGDDLIYSVQVPKKELGKVQRQINRVILPDVAPTGATNGATAAEDLATVGVNATPSANGAATVAEEPQPGVIFDPRTRLQSTSEIQPEFSDPNNISGFLRDEEIPGGLRRELDQTRGGQPEYRIRFEATETPKGTFQVVTKRGRLTANGSQLVDTTNPELVAASIPPDETYPTPQDALDAAEQKYKSTILNRYQTDQDNYNNILDLAAQEVQRRGGNITPDQLATRIGSSTDYARKVLIDLQQSGRLGAVPQRAARRFQPLEKEIGQDGSLVTRFRWGDREFTSTLSPEGTGSHFTLTTADPQMGEVVIKEGSLPQPPSIAANQPVFNFNTLDQDVAERLGAATPQTPPAEPGVTGNGATPPPSNGSLPYSRVQYPPPTDPMEVLSTVKAAVQGKGSVPLTPYLASVPDDVLTKADEQIQQIIATTPGFKNTERAIRSRIFNEIERRTSPEATQSADDVLYLINQRLNRGEHYWSIRGSLNNFSNDEILSGLDEAYRRGDPSFQTLQQEARRRGLIQVNPPPEIPTAPAAEPTRLNPEFTVSKLPPAPKPLDLTAEQVVKNQLTTIQTAAGVDPAKVDQVFSFMEPLIRGNTDHFLTQRIAGDYDLRQGILKAMQAGDEKTQRSILYDTFRQQDQLWSALGVKSPIFNKALGWLDDATGKASTHIGEAKKYATAVSDRNVDLLNYFADKYPKFGDLLRNSEEAINKAQGELDGLRDMADQLAVANGAPQPGRKTGTLDDIREVIRRYGDEDQKSQMEQWLKDNYYPATDSAREIYLSKLSGTVHDEIKKMYRLSPEEMRRYKSAYSKFMGIMREQALLSPKYHAANIFDGTSRSLLYGVNIANGRTADRLAEKDGIQIPEVVSASFERTMAPDEITTFGGKETRFPNRQRLMEMAGNTYTGRTFGRVAGIPAAINRYLTLAVESTMRKAGWAAEYTRFKTEEVAPTLERQIKDLDPSHADAVIKEFKDADWSFTQQEAASLAQKHGVSPEVANQISQLWGQGLNEASQSGVNFSNKLYLVYTDERKIEEKMHLRGWLMFHSWATRNLPFYAETLAKNPWLLRAFNTYMNASEDERNRLGLSKSYVGKLPLGPLALPTFMLGEHNRIWFNPMATFSIFDQTKSLGTNYDSDNKVEQGMNLLGGVGLSPASWIPMVLNLVGYYGEGDPQRLSRQSGVIAATTGHDPEGYLLDAQRAIRNHTSGILPGSKYVPGYTQSGNASVDYNTQKHLRELGVALTGDPRAFQSATPDSDIYQAAQQQAEKENRFRQLAGFISPLPLTVTTDQEENLRQQAKSLNARLPQQPPKGDTSPAAEMQRQLNSQAYLAAIQQGDPGTAYSGIAYGDSRKAEIEAGIYWLNRYGWPQGRPNGVQAAIIADYPALGDYLNWRASRPASQDNSLATYLQTVR